MKVEVEFPCDFSGNEVSPIQLGRLYLGSRAVRIAFDKDGNMKLLIPQSAIRDGLVILWEDQPPGEQLFGLGKPDGG